MTGIKNGKKGEENGRYNKENIRYLHISHNAPYLPPPPKILDKHALFTVSLGTAVIPRRNEKQRVMQNRGANKVHCGRCASATTKQKH